MKLTEAFGVMADAIRHARPQVLIARDAGLSEKHVSQVLTGKSDGSFDTWQRMLDAAGLTIRIEVAPAQPVSTDPQPEEGP